MARIDDHEECATAVDDRGQRCRNDVKIAIVGERPRQNGQHQQGRRAQSLDFHPGEALQVDWADFGFALPGVPRRVCAFVAVLCYSRLLYIEFTVGQAMGSFLRSPNGSAGAGSIFAFSTDSNNSRGTRRVVPWVRAGDVARPMFGTQPSIGEIRKRLTIEPALADVRNLVFDTRRVLG